MVKSYPLGTTLEEIKNDLGIQLASPVYGALVNNKVKELSFTVVKSFLISSRVVPNGYDFTTPVFSQ